MKRLAIVILVLGVLVVGILVVERVMSHDPKNLPYTVEGSGK